MIKNITLVIFTFTLSTIVNAEIYKDFEPNLSLKVIKERYPNAEFSDLKPAWIKSNELFLDMHGTGISGNIYLKLSSNEYWKDKLESETDPEMITFYESMANRPIEEKLTLDWVRFLPISRIPFERLKTKYGKAEKCSYFDENFTPYCSWDSKGVLVSLTDDKKYVNYIEYTFTVKDWKKKWKAFPSSK